MSVDLSTDTDDLPELTPEARLREVAAIFADGILRLAGRVALPQETSSDIPSVLDGNPLEETG
ncbi:hypothetical protein BH11PLA2_BH11PLA2_20990 [soil metagenome]